MSKNKKLLIAVILVGFLILLFLFFKGVFGNRRKSIEKIPNNAENIDDQADAKAECVRAGCSGELCVKAEIADQIATTCEYKAEYGCYQNATCELQENGDCGFTQTQELLNCLEGVIAPPRFPNQ